MVARKKKVASPEPDGFTRYVRSATDAIPAEAMDSGLTAGLLAGANQYPTMMVDRRINYGQQPEAGPGAWQRYTNALSDVVGEPSRLDPRSPGFAEGAGAGTTNFLMNAVDPAGALLGNGAARLAGRGVRGAAHGVTHSTQPIPQMGGQPAFNTLSRVSARQSVPPRGAINPHFAPTGNERALRLRMVTPPNLEGAPFATKTLTDFQNAIRSGDSVRAFRILDREGRLVDDRLSSSPQREALYEYMVDVVNQHIPATRQAPGTIRSSNSNAPALGGNAQPDPYAPTISRNQ